MSTVPWSPSFLHAPSCTLRSAATARHNAVVHFVYRQLERSAVIKNPRDGFMERRVFTDEDRASTDNHRPDIGVHNMDAAAVANLRLSGACLNHSPYESPTVTVMMDVFFSDMLSLVPTKIVLPDHERFSGTGPLLDPDELHDPPEVASAAKQDAAKIQKYKRQVERYSADHRVNVILLPLHFDPCGWASADTTRFLTYLFNLEYNATQRSPTTPAPPDLLPPTPSHHLPDSTSSTRWRELSSLITSHTFPNAIGNFASACSTLHRHSTSSRLLPAPPPSLHTPTLRNGT